MYYALIDILDSLIEENDVNQSVAMMYYHQFQSDMTEVLYKDYDGLHKILVKYQFPNIPRKKANDFINDMLKQKIEIFVIVHGNGQGILKETTFSTLKKNKNVLEYKGFYYNTGCTLVRIKI